MLERIRGTLLRQDDCETVIVRLPRCEVEQLACGVGIELRRRLVEDEQRRLEGERRCEAHALQLAAGEIVHPSSRQVRDAERVQCGMGARADRVCRGACVLEPEGDLSVDPLADELLLGILEHVGDRTRKLRRPVTPRIGAAELDAARERAATTSPASNSSDTSASAGRAGPGYVNDKPSTRATATALPVRRPRRRTQWRLDPRCSTTPAAGVSSLRGRSLAPPSPRRG